MALAGNRELPADVVAFTPLQGRLGRRRYTRGQGAPPLGPGQRSSLHRRRGGPWRRGIRGRFGAQEAGASGRNQDPRPPLSASLYPRTSEHHARGVDRPGGRRDRNPAQKPQAGLETSSRTLRPNSRNTRSWCGCRSPTPRCPALCTNRWSCPSRRRREPEGRGPC